jgi:hypothetical protein
MSKCTCVCCVCRLTTLLCAASFFIRNGSPGLCIKMMHTAILLKHSSMSQKALQLTRHQE